MENFRKIEAIFPKTALKIVIWVFFRGLKSKSGYFLGFSKKISNENIPITSTLRVPPQAICSDVCIRPNVILPSVRWQFEILQTKWQVMKHSFVNKWLQFSNYTLAIKYDSSFQLMKRLCDDTSPFVLASIRVESGELFRRRRCGRTFDLSGHLTVQGRRVVLANELNPVLTSWTLSVIISVGTTMWLFSQIIASSMFSPSNTLLICKFRYCKCVMTVERTQP